MRRSKPKFDEHDAYELNDPKHPTYVDRLVERVEEAGDYKFTVLTAGGRQFSIHLDQESANQAAKDIGGSVTPHVPNPSTYWDDLTSGSRYDH